MPCRQRSHEPWRGDERFIHNLGSSERQQVTPLYAAEPLIPEPGHAAFSAATAGLCSRDRYECTRAP
jgi:hypothetical protein